MSAPAARTGGRPLGCRCQDVSRGGGVGGRVVTGVGEAVRGSTRRDPFSTLPDRIGKGDEVVLIGMDGGQRTGVPDQLPAARRSDAAGMRHAQIP